MKLYRIADRRHPVWSGTGALLNGARFNSPGRPVIYAALTFAGAMLEVLVHARIGKVPKTHVFVEAQVPDDVAIERHDAATLPQGWDAPALAVARRFGDAWLAEARSAVLLLPSVVARAERNALVNPLHPDASRIAVTEAQPVVWDERLFVVPPRTTLAQRDGRADGTIRRAVGAPAAQHSSLMQSRGGMSMQDAPRGTIIRENTLF